MKHNRMRMLVMSMLLTGLLLVSMPAMGSVVEPESSTVPQVLTYLLPYSPDNLDPTRSTLFATFYVISLMLDTMVVLDRNFQPIPHLAESWEMSEDGLMWTFHLREGVRFHDGTPLNAEAVAFSLNRFANEARHAWMLGPLEKAIAIDEYTVEMRYTEPFPLLLDMLSKQWTGIVSPTAVEKYGDDFGIRNMIGSGPFMLEEFIPGDRAILVRNDEYTWGPPYVQNKGPAHLEQIIFRFIPEEMTRLMELEAGTGMITLFLPHAEVPRLRADPNIQIAEAFMTGADYVAFNVTKWPFDDIRVRQAFIHAVDVEILIEAVLEGLAKRAYGLIAPGQVGYWQGLPEFAAPFVRHDPEKAKQLLAEAGWALGPDGILVHAETGRRAEFEWWRCAIPGAELDAAEVKMAQLRKIGIDINLVLMEGGTLAVRRGEGVHHIFQWAYSFPHACRTLRFFYHSDTIGHGNANHFSCAKMDELIDTALIALDPLVRSKAIAEAQRHATELALMLPLWHGVIHHAATADVGGFEFMAIEKRPFGNWSRNSVALDFYIRQP